MVAVDSRVCYLFLPEILHHLILQTCRGLLLTPLVLQSRFGDKPLKFQVVCPRNGNAVLNGLILLLQTVMSVEFPQGRDRSSALGFCQNGKGG